MADNIAVTAGSGTTVSTEELTALNGGAVDAQHAQRTLTAFRTDDATAYDASTGAGAVDDGVQRVTLASDDPLVAATQAMQNSTLPVLVPSAATLVKGLTAAMTTTASTAVTGMGAPGGGLYNYITSIVVGNSHATVGTFVELQDGNGGTTFWTGPAAPAYGGFALALPTPIKQPTANTALYVKCATSGANVIASFGGYTGA